MLKKLIDNYINPSRNIAKDTKSIFFWMEDAVKYYEEIECGTLSESVLKKSKSEFESYMRVMGKKLKELYKFEITYETFQKCILDEKTLAVLKKAYDFNPDYFTRENTRSRLRLVPSPNPYVSKKSAKKKFDEYVKAWKTDINFPAKLIFGKQVNKAAEEAIYYYRNWMLNEFDTIVDLVEPLRHEYIITRKGQVEPKEVDEYLDSVIKQDELLSTYFEDYSLYEFALLSRPVTDFLYYPDMKF